MPTPNIDWFEVRFDAHGLFELLYAVLERHHFITFVKHYKKIGDRMLLRLRRSCGLFYPAATAYVHLYVVMLVGDSAGADHIFLSRGFVATRRRPVVDSAVVLLLLIAI